MRDPYIEFVKVIKEKGKSNKLPSVQIGTIINKDTLKIGELQITRENLYIADYLRSGYKRNLELDGLTKEYVNKDTLKPGDNVAVIPTEDRQIYIILCKVVMP